jgi:hypothetical protein
MSPEPDRYLRHAGAKSWRTASGGSANDNEPPKRPVGRDRLFFWVWRLVVILGAIAVGGLWYLLRATL